MTVKERYARTRGGKVLHDKLPTNGAPRGEPIRLFGIMSAAYADGAIDGSVEALVGVAEGEVFVNRVGTSRRAMIARALNVEVADRLSKPKEPPKEPEQEDFLPIILSAIRKGKPYIVVSHASQRRPWTSIELELSTAKGTITGNGYSKVMEPDKWSPEQGVYIATYSAAEHLVEQLRALGFKKWARVPHTAR
jgi:hypothetical protein